MGLTIYYRLKAKVDAAGACRLVERLHRVAKRLPFDSVSPIFEHDAPEGKYTFERGDEGPMPWKPGGVYLEHKCADGLTDLVDVPSLHVVCFHANLKGSETASFGLASHPPVVVHREDVVTKLPDGGEERQRGAGPAVEVPTRLRGWYSWSSFCKTQYAGDPRLGGPKNFLRAHLSVFKMIDHAKRLGFKTHIRDDAKYWRHRDERKLLAELAKWDEIIAGFTGRLGDIIGTEPGKLVAPIKDRPDFEHLEARGAKRLTRKGVKRRRKSRDKRKGAE